MSTPDNANGFPMNEGPATKMSSPKAREERLAAKLRENLRRRKAQGKAQGKAEARGLDDSDASDATETLPNPPSSS